jgi:hypothetical protein
MNGWELVVPVIVVLIYIVGHFLRSGEKEEQRPAVRRNRSSEERTPRRANTDIDRFLDEVNRRRRQAMDRRTGPAEHEATPLRVPQRPRPSAGVDRPRRTVSSPVVRTVPIRPTLSAARPVEPVPAVEVIPIIEIPTAMPASPLEMQPITASPIPIAPTGTTSAPSPDLGGLLSTPDSLRAAVILQEILGPPVSRRRGIR